MRSYGGADCSISIHALLAESDALSGSALTHTTLFLSTLSLRRATNGYKSQLCATRPISIHALLAESDKKISGIWREQKYFYPRSPCGERPCATWVVFRRSIFLSTLSLRRATNTGQPVRGLPRHFYPRSPCGERPCYNVVSQLQYSTISIHALLAESDAANCYLDNIEITISIHALLAESDVLQF